MPIDFSPLYAPTPESPTSRGLRGIGDALDAVVARRTQMEQARMQREQADKHALMVDQRVRDQNATADRNVDETRALRERMFGVTTDLKERGLGERMDATDLALEKLAAQQEYEGDAPGAAETRMRLNARRAGRGAPAGAATSPPPAAGPAPAPKAPTPQVPPGETGPALIPGSNESIARYGVNFAPVENELGPMEDWPTTPQPGATPAPSPAAPPAPIVPTDVAGAVARGAMYAARSPQAEGDAWFAEISRDPNLEPSVKAMLPQLRDAIKAGRGARRFTGRDAMGAVNDERKRLAAMGRATLMADSMRGNRQLGQERTALGIEGDWDRMIKVNVLDQFNAKGLMTEKGLLDSLSTISGRAMDNSAFAALLRGKWARYAQGAGVLTDQDLKVFYEGIEGILGRAGSSLEAFLTGNAAPAVVKEIEQALGSLQQAAIKKERALGGKIQIYLEGKHADPQRIADALKLHSPSYYNTYMRKLGKKPAPAPSAGPEAKASAAPSLDAINEAADEDEAALDATP